MLQQSAVQYSMSSALLHTERQNFMLLGALQDQLWFFLVSSAGFARVPHLCLRRRLPRLAPGALVLRHGQADNRDSMHRIQGQHVRLAESFLPIRLRALASEQ